MKTITVKITDEDYEFLLKRLDYLKKQDNGMFEVTISDAVRHAIRKNFERLKRGQDGADVD